MRTPIRPICLTLLAVLLLGGCSTAPTLLFEQQNEVWKSHADGTGKVKLANGNYPQWIPGVKDKIAYVRYQSGTQIALFIADADGKNEQQLTGYTSGEYFSWSPDRNWIAFQSNRDGNWEIYKINVNTKQEVRLTNHSATDKRPRWSPKGTYIAFESDRRTSDWDVWIMNPNGGSLNNLTGGAPIPDGFDGNAMWSPNGTDLAFICNHIGWGTGPQICLTDTAGAKMGPFALNGATLTAPIWSPSGDYILYVGSTLPNYILYRQPAASIQSGAQTLATWTAASAGEHLAINETTLFYTKGIDLYAIQWRTGSERKLGSGYNPSVW